MKAEDIIFKYVGLEGTLKSIGCYEDVIRAMNDYVKISKENTLQLTFSGLAKKRTNKKYRFTDAKNTIIKNKH